MSDNLSNKPLIEAMFELKWELQPSQFGGKRDPNYQLLIGRFFDKIKDEYPSYEPMNSASIPEEIVGGVIQHRFRKSDNQYPLVQLGPGILTINSTEDYSWINFQSNVLSIINKFYEAYPKEDELNISSLTLRYIDVIDVNSDEISIYDFLQNKLKTNLSLDKSLFLKTQLEAEPLALRLNLTFKCRNPKGTMFFNLVKGQRNQKDAIILDYAIISQKSDLPDFPKEAEQWLNDAHNVSHNWFFSLTEGELLESFR